MTYDDSDEFISIDLLNKIAYVSVRKVLILKKTMATLVMWHNFP